MTRPLYVVDAFADEAFAGNPAAVCVLDGAADEAWMQRVAREMSLSETAFVRWGDDGFDLRWFTPKVEVDLCGHATLATAHVLWERRDVAPDGNVKFRTKSGVLWARPEGQLIVLDFPATPPEPASAPEGLAAALRVDASAIGHVAKSRFDYLVELPSADAVAAVSPDFRALGDLPVRGVIVTAPGSGATDFVSRFFAPGAGVDEDPVTGSAHCTLGPHWAERLGKKDMTARQLSARGGSLRVVVEGDRVELGGRAVTVVRGELVA